jgi:hypothetical protein
VVIALLNFTSFSQKDTSRICLTYPVAQNIAIELVQKDSLNAELKIVKNILKESQNKIKFQDSTIISFEKKEIEHKSEVKIFEEKEKVYNANIKDLKEKNTDLEQKNKNLRTITNWLGGGLISTLTTLIALISLK